MKSSLIRTATLDPIGAARKIDQLTAERDKLKEQVRVLQDEIGRAHV